MDEPKHTTVQQESTHQKKSSKKLTILLIIVAVLVLGAVTMISWLYLDSVRTVSNQHVVISDLQKQLKDLGMPVPGGVVSEIAEGSPSCSGGSAYSADIGNFDLTLSDPNVIVRALDANFEGGPITQLSIGQCIAGETNVVDAYPTREVKIIGHPASNSATLRANFEAQWGSPLTSGGTVDIDGVTAQIYTGDGLFASKLLYFDNGGIGYQIELTDTNPASEAMLTDVVSDWSFTP